MLRQSNPEPRKVGFTRTQTRFPLPSTRYPQPATLYPLPATLYQRQVDPRLDEGLEQVQIDHSLARLFGENVESALRGNGALVRPARLFLTANVLRGSRIVDSVRLYDDGSHGDLQAADAVGARPSRTPTPWRPRGLPRSPY